MSRFGPGSSPLPVVGTTNFPPYSIGSHGMASRSPDPYSVAQQQQQSNIAYNRQPVQPQQQQDQGNIVNSARGRSESQPSQSNAQQNFESHLESQGLTSSAVELGLLQSKLRSAHSDLQRTRHELREATERASSLSSQLNNQKVENSTLTHQYAALLARLTDAESDKSRFDEEIRLERESHQATREAMEQERSLAAQREHSLNQHITALDSKIHNLQQQVQDAQQAQLQAGGAGNANRGGARGLSGAGGSNYQDPYNNGVLPTAQETAVAYERYIRLTEVLTTQVDRTLEELLVQFSEDDVFVINSMCKSTANEVEARIATADMRIKDAVDFNVRQREVENQIVNFATSLLQENKELWNNISRLQVELEQTAKDLEDVRDRERGLTEAAPLRERIAYLEQQNAALEEDTRAVRRVVDEQKEREKEHEAAARRLMEELKTLSQKYEHINEDRAALQRTLDDTATTAAEASGECEQLRDQANRLRKDNDYFRKQLESIEHDHRTQADLQLNDLIEKIRVAQQERNDAQKDADQARFQNEELRDHSGELERELMQRDELVAQLRQQIDETRQQCLTTLEQQITSQRNMYERELADLRDRNDELASRERAAPIGLIEDLQNDVARLEQEVDMQRGAARDRDQEVHDLRDQIRNLVLDRDQAAERERDATTRSQASEREAERAQSEMQRLAAAVEAESSRTASKLQAAEQEVEHLQEQILESERQRQQLMEELRITRQSMRGANVNDETLRQLREKWERDREELVRENERLQRENKLVNGKYVESMEQNRQFRESGGGVAGASSSSASRGLQEGSYSGRDPREVATLQARLEGQNRRLAEEQKKRDDVEAEKKKLQEHVRQLQQEKQVLETRMDHIVNQIRKEQELDLGAPMKSAMTQHRRFNDQTAEMDALIHQSRAGSSSTANRNNPPAAPPQTSSSSSPALSGQQQQHQQQQQLFSTAPSARRPVAGGGVPSTAAASSSALPQSSNNAVVVNSTSSSAAPVRRPPPPQPSAAGTGTGGASTSSWRP